ncbi:MAG: flagellar export chaperone FlgN [Oscillospiraceae bacterium]|nr:flagellar export chaperone FlgN [Oscillospiraceae bacterium]
MADYARLIDFFDEYIEHYREFKTFEVSKLDMLNKNQIEQLSSSLSTEQALIMKTNSMETKRMKLLEGVEGTNFTEVIDKAPAEFKGRLSEQHEELSYLIYKIKELNDIANGIVSKRLKFIQNKTAELDVYDGKGSVKREHATKAAILKNV